MAPKKTDAISAKLMSVALAEGTSAAATASSEVMRTTPSAPLAATASDQRTPKNGVLFRVLHNAVSTFSMTNGLGSKKALDANQDVVLSIAFDSSPTQQVWVEFGLKLTDVGRELKGTPAEE